MNRRMILIAAVMFSSLPLFSASQLQLKTIGVTSGSNLFLTYISIGVVADSYHEKVYDRNKAVGFMRSIIGQSVIVRENLQALVNSKELSDADSLLVKEMITCYSLLVQEAEAFILYAQTGDKKKAEEFHSHRKAAWKKIAAFMGLKKAP